MTSIFSGVGIKNGRLISPVQCGSRRPMRKMRYEKGKCGMYCSFLSMHTLTDTCKGRINILLFFMESTAGRMNNGRNMQGGLTDYHEKRDESR